MVAACAGCGEEKRVERASTQQTWAIGTVESGSKDGVALGEVRGRQCCVAANVRGFHAVLSCSGGSVGTDQHHQLARLPSSFENALRGRRIARAINAASGFRRPLTAVAVAEQLSSAARVTV